MLCTVRACRLLQELAKARNQPAPKEGDHPLPPEEPKLRPESEFHAEVGTINYVSYMYAFRRICLP